MEYTFVLKYQISGDESDADALVERLAVAGCDDALVGIGSLGGSRWSSRERRTPPRLPSAVRLKTYGERFLPHASLRRRQISWD